MEKLSCALLEQDAYRKSIIELKIKEEENRKIRRMTANIGLPTLRLIRTSIGEWKLGELKP